MTLKKKKNTRSSIPILLGIDYGTTNIGLAFGVGDSVAPLKIISGKHIPTALNDISRVVLENKISKLIVGLPLTADGRETPQAKEVRKFAKLLKIRLKMPVEFVDEFGSSRDAIPAMLQMGVSKKGRQKVDDYSAAVILKNYLAQT